MTRPRHTFASDPEAGGRVASSLWSLMRSAPRSGRGYARSGRASEFDLGLVAEKLGEAGTHPVTGVDTNVT